MLGLRALLGVTESVVAPTNVALSVMWYKKSEQPLIIAGYQAMLGLSSILSGLYGFGNISFPVS
jgi:MFS family permease